MKMFMPSCLHLVGTILMIQISTQPYVFGRPSPPASYDLETTTPLPEDTEPFQTGVIPRRTPEESFDVVEKILQGELQPVFKTADLSFEPTDLNEVPTLTGSQNNDFLKMPELVDESAFYFESPQSIDKPDMKMNLKQEFPFVESSHENSPSFYQRTSADAFASPESHPRIETLEKEEKPVPLQMSAQTPTDIHTQVFLSHSSQNLPEVGDADFVNNNLAFPGSILPTDKLVEDKMLKSEPTTFQRTQIENSFASHPITTNFVENIQDFSNIVSDGVAIESMNSEITLPKDSTETSVAQIIPLKSSMDSALPEDHGQSSSISGVAQGTSPQEVLQLTRTLESSVPQDLQDQFYRDVQDLPERVKTGIGNRQFNFPEDTLRTVPTDESSSAHPPALVKANEFIHVNKSGDNVPVEHNFPEESVENVPVLPGTDTSSMKDAEVSDLVPNKEMRDLQLDHIRRDGNDNAEFEGAAVENLTKNSAGRVVSSMREDGPVLAEGTKDLIGFSVLQQMKNNVPSAFPKLIAKAPQDVQDNPRIAYPVLKSFKPSSLLDPRKSFDMNLKPSMHVGKTLLQRRTEAPNEVSSKVAENLVFPTESPGHRGLADNGMKDMLQEKLTDVDRISIAKKDSGDFRFGETDRLALSDILDSRQDSRSFELLWSAEDSEEDDEFWRKMKRFIEFENALPDERDETKIDAPRPSVNLSENLNAIPSVETKPTETPVIHVMRIPKPRLNNIEQGEERDQFYGGLETGTDENFQTSDGFPAQEESSTVLPTNEDLETTEVTVPTTGLSNDLSYGSDVDIGEYNPFNFETTERPSSYSSPIERPEYENAPIFLEPDTSAAKHDGNRQTAKAVVNFEVTSPENAFGQSTEFTNRKTFQKDQPKQTPRHDVLPCSRELFPGSVGGPDYVPELKDDRVLSKNDPRFSEGITESFTTDEPLAVDDETYVEYSVKSPSSVSKQESELLSEPTDLELIEADSPMLTLSNRDHFVSKKDNPMKTVNGELQDRQKTKGLPEIPPKIPKNYVYPLPFEAISRKRVRRNEDQTKGRVEEHGLNDTESSTQSVSITSSYPTSSTVRHPIPSTPLSFNPVLPTSPSPDIGSEASGNVLSSSIVQLLSTTTVTPNRSAFPETPAPSIASTTPAPSAEFAQSSTSTSLLPPATFEMLPTPIPYTSTTVNPSTLKPTNTTKPKKKKKMVWKIPFYPNNIAITSSGEVRLEPKDKSALLLTTTQKPMLLRNQLKPEDLQAARERLFRRFQARIPSTVPVLGAARTETLKTGLPLMSAPIMKQSSTGGPPERPKVYEDVLAYVTADNPSQLPSLLYNSPEEREEARRRRLRSMVGLAGDVRSFLSDRARGAVRTVGSFVGGGTQKKDNV